jgi:hypothetical protein
MAAAANCRKDARGSGEIDGFDNVLTILAVGDQCGTTVDHSVTNGASGVVTLISWAHQLTRQPLAERFHSAAVDLHLTGSDARFNYCHGLDPCLVWAAGKLDAAPAQSKIEFVR